MKTAYILACLTIVLDLTSPPPVQALDIGDHHYPDQISVDGKPLKRVGAGLREFLFFDIYSMGLYSKSASCKPSVIVSQNEPKYLLLKMSRDIPAKRLASNMKDTLEANLPKNAPQQLKDNVTRFISYLKKDCKKNSTLSLTYFPKKGTILKQDNRRLGQTIKGHAFIELILKSYFGLNTCCSKLKQAVLNSCHRS